MAKQATPKILTFLFCAIPWAFFLAAWDLRLSLSLWPFFLAVLLGLGGVGWYCGKRQLAPQAVAGNAASCFLSIVLTIRYFGVTNYTFTPFRPVDYMLFLSALLLSEQVTLWRVQRKAAAPSLIAQFAESLAILFFSAVALIFLLLWFSQLSL